MVFEPNLDKNMFDEVLNIKEMCQARGNPPIFITRLLKIWCQPVQNGAFQLRKTCDVTREPV